MKILNSHTKKQKTNSTDCNSNIWYNNMMQIENNTGNKYKYRNSQFQK